MLLCIDIGNTNTVLATFDGDKLVHSWRIKTDSRSTADELGLKFRGLLAGDAVEITGVAACSTVPAALRSLRMMLARYYGDLPNVVVEPGVKTGVQLAIDNPKEVGADRVVNTLAAQVDRIVERMTEELGWVQAVIATGGLAGLVKDECRTITAHEPMITLIG